MNYRLAQSVLFIAALLISVSTVLSQDHEHDESALSPEDRILLHEVRGANAPYHDLTLALEAGYGEFLSCFAYGGELGMGQHYVNGDLAGDAVLDPMLPEALVYEPGRDGEMILVALEYLVFADVWDPDNSGREAPKMFGQEFLLETGIPETPPVWALHLWLFAHNPDGLFAHFNPIIFCAEDEPVVDMSGG